MKLKHRISTQIATANKELAFEIPEKINLKQAIKLAADNGLVLKKDPDGSGEFIVYIKGKKNEDYWTNDLHDALGTGRAMLKHAGKLKEHASSDEALKKALDYMDTQLKEMRKLIDSKKLGSAEDFTDTLKGAYKRTLTKLKTEATGV